MTTKEEFKVTGEEVVKKMRELIAEGNVRRVIVKNKEGRVVLEVPLTLGVIGAAIAPVMAAIGAAAALLAECSIVVEREK